MLEPDWLASNAYRVLGVAVGAGPKDVHEAAASLRRSASLGPSKRLVPHSISVEVVAADGKSGLQKIFDRSTPLPAERTHQFRADHAVSSLDPSSGLRIK